MFEIAGGIVLAVLFFALLPLALQAGAAIVAIVLAIVVGAAIIVAPICMIYSGFSAEPATFTAAILFYAVLYLALRHRSLPRQSRPSRGI